MSWTASPSERSLEAALDRARDFLQRREEGKENEDCENSTISNNSLNRSLNGRDSSRRQTPEEYKQELGNRRFRELIDRSFSTGNIQWPSSFSSAANESSLEEENCQQPTKLDLDESKNQSLVEVAEEELWVETSKLRIKEEAEISAMYEEADRFAQQEQERFLNLYRALHADIKSQYQKVEHEIHQEITRRKQMLINNAKKDSEMLLQLHKSLAEKSAASGEAYRLKSQGIFKMVEEAKQAEEKLLKENQLKLLKEENKLQAQNIIANIDETINSLQKDLAESLAAKEQLLIIKGLLNDEATLEKPTVIKEAVEKIRNVVSAYQEQLKKRDDENQKNKEQPKAVESKIPAKDKLNLGFYVEAVDRLKRNTESWAEFIENNKILRANILRFVQLTVNKIQMMTDNMQHTLAFVKLFSKETVSVGTASTMLSLAGNPEALSYAMDLTAKKLLDNVEKLPSEPAKEWVPFATVAATLWSMSGKFGEVFFDNLVSRCPFLIPVYFEDLSDDESLKYVTQFVFYKNEDWPSFTRRMGYYARLLGVICSVKPRHGLPFPPSRMWKLLSSTMKTKLGSRQLCEVSALVMKNLIETSGFTMKQAFGHQFTKLIHVLCTEYFDKLKVHANGSPNLVNLEVFMKEVINSDCRFSSIC